MDIFFKDNLNSSDQLYIEQLLCASMAASTDNTGSWGITPALTDILDADGWWFAASDPDLISKSCPVSKTYLSGCMAVYQTGDDSFECVPFVHPDLRKREFFLLLSWLLPVKKTKFQEKALCIFPVVLKINCGKMSWNILGQSMPGMNI